MTIETSQPNWSHGEALTQRDELLALNLEQLKRISSLEADKAECDRVNLESMAHIQKLETERATDAQAFASPAARIANLEAELADLRESETTQARISALEAAARDSAETIATLQHAAKEDRKFIDDQWVELHSMRGERDAGIAEVARLDRLINTPHTDDFLQALQLEAAHQIERWGAEHDAGKRPEDWIALVVYLTGKAVSSHYAGDAEKLKHHVIATAASCLNWFRALVGDSNAMRPGVVADRRAP